ncbi:hypothetical protein YA0016_08405 [Pseudomonas syringae]|uniref:hypothetical protein n=1 Tax=Pseudomonas syringae group TaxID=136849 RepID=UPI000CF6C7BC|nr:MULTISPECIES: hypothetical protein [Pseudomonas syringae group]AVI85634.1 hypothetical protein XJ28_18990 [Pseudomonas syringae pv. tomato]MBI6841753.1 hypothetical protein [Pseudomonas syringae]QBI62601.1 hypothetical protein EIZ61_14570 [Pseudomonas syringae]
MNKIPEGTQYIESGCGEKGFRKYEKGCWWFFEGHWRHVDWKMGDLIPVFEHPLYAAQPATWSGEGLPPVGTVCEVAAPIHWHSTKVRVLCHDEGDAVCRVLEGDMIGDLKQLMASELRPIRTAEQIEADQKKQEVQELIIILGSVESAAYKDIAIAIQQANFRKQVSQ